MIPRIFFVTIELEYGITPTPDAPVALDVEVGPLDFRREMMAEANAARLLAARDATHPGADEAELASRVARLDNTQVWGMCVREAQVRRVGDHDPCSWTPGWSATIATEDLNKIMAAANEVAERSRTFRAGRKGKVEDAAAAESRNGVDSRGAHGHADLAPEPAP